MYFKDQALQDYLSLKMKAPHFFEKSEIICSKTHLNIPEDVSLQKHHRENIKPRRISASCTLKEVAFVVTAV
jgi:hypothetical protein